MKRVFNLLMKVAAVAVLATVTWFVYTDLQPTKTPIETAAVDDATIDPSIEEGGVSIPEAMEGESEKLAVEASANNTTSTGSTPEDTTLSAATTDNPIQEALAETSDSPLAANPERETAASEVPVIEINRPETVTTEQKPEPVATQIDESQPTSNKENPIAEAPETPTVTTPKAATAIPSARQAIEESSPQPALVSGNSIAIPDNSAPSPQTTKSTAQTAATVTAEESGISATPQPTTQNDINRARRTAWNGAWDKAEDIYRQLQQEQPDNHDVHGELGNLLFMQGRWAEAATSYYKTAILLAQAGHQMDARNLQHVVTRLDSQMGIKLEKELAATIATTQQATPER